MVCGALRIFVRVGGSVVGLVVVEGVEVGLCFVGFGRVVDLVGILFRLAHSNQYNAVVV